MCTAVVTVGSVGFGVATDPAERSVHPLWVPGPRAGHGRGGRCPHGWAGPARREGRLGRVGPSRASACLGRPGRRRRSPCDHDVGGLHDVVGQRLGELLRQVETNLGHGGQDGGVDLVGGDRSGGADVDPAGGVVVEQRCGHLRAAGVVYADEQYFRGGHQGSFGFGSGQVGETGAEPRPAAARSSTASSRERPAVWRVLTMGITAPPPSETVWVAGQVRRRRAHRAT